MIKEKHYEEKIDTKKLNKQKAIIIKKDLLTKKVDKYLEDKKTGRMIHKYTLPCDKKDIYKQGTYVNLVEFTTTILTYLYEKYGIPESLTFITKDNEELSPLETMEKTCTFCLENGLMSIGDEYLDLVMAKDKIEEYFKNLKAKVLVKKILVVDGIGQKK